MVGGGRHAPLKLSKQPKVLSGVVEPLMVSLFKNVMMEVMIRLIFSLRVANSQFGEECGTTLCVVENHHSHSSQPSFAQN